MQYPTPELELVCRVELGKDGSFEFPVRFGDASSVELVPVRAHLSNEEVERQSWMPVVIHGLDSTGGYWIFDRYVVRVRDVGDLNRAELVVLIKKFVETRRNDRERRRSQTEAINDTDLLSSARRERITEAVRIFVWKRDEGKCVKCGRRKKLEFDHIIPLADGGSNTDRNIQLLCEQCNRQKGKNVI